MEVTTTSVYLLLILSAATNIWAETCYDGEARNTTETKVEPDRGRLYLFEDLNITCSDIVTSVTLFTHGVGDLYLDFWSQMSENEFYLLHSENLNVTTAGSTTLPLSNTVAVNESTKIGIHYHLQRTADSYDLQLCTRTIGSSRTRVKLGLTEDDFDGKTLYTEFRSKRVRFYDVTPSIYLQLGYVTTTTTAATTTNSAAGNATTTTGVSNQSTTTTSGNTAGSIYGSSSLMLSTLVLIVYTYSRLADSLVG